MLSETSNKGVCAKCCAGCCGGLDDGEDWDNAERAGARKTTKEPPAATAPMRTASGSSESSEVPVNG